jgi:PAS domain S-box-containing protein
MKKISPAWSYSLAITSLIFAASVTILVTVQVSSNGSLLRLALLFFIILSLIASFLIYRKISEKEKTFDENYEKLSAIFEYVPIGICFLEITSGKILEVNQGYLDMFGYSKEEVIGNSSIGLGIIDYKERKKLITEVQQSGFVKNRVMRFNTKSGGQFTCVLSYKLVKLNGKDCGIVLLSNASSNKDLDTALAENMRKFQTIFDSSPTGICIVELESGKIFDANKAFLGTYGYAKEELIGHSTIELGIMHSEERNKYLEELNAKGSLRNWEQVTYTKDGKEITGLLSDIIIDLNNKKYSLTLINDISEIKKIETALFENKTKLQTLFDFNPGGIALFDLETGKIQEVNQAFLDICGFTREEMLDHTVTELGILPPGLRTTYKYKLEEFGTIRNLEQIIRRKNGSLVTILFSSIVLDIGGRKCTLDIINDISDRKELENQLVAATERAHQAVKSEERFLANMSHEIRTPMNGIIGMVNLLEQTRLNDEQKEYAGWIKDSSEILLTIINDILDISKINAGKMAFEKTPFSIYDVLRNLTISMELKAKEKNIAFHSHMDLSVPQKVLGDPVRLFQILLNLAGNAVKFTDKGEVTISINKLKEDSETISLEFIVRDTGIGIAPEKITALFEPFVQAASDITRKYGGTGLGLSISKRLVEMQGGVIHAESELGKGSAFTFNLTYKKYVPGAKPSVVNHAKELLNGRNISGIRVLLAEDNKISQKVAVKTMGKWGVTVDVADNGLKVVELAGSKHYDLILMDVQMPEMDGFEATNQIRNFLPPPASKVPIIAMTASVIRLDKAKCIELGMDDYISKPFKPEELYKMLSAHALPASPAEYTAKPVSNN